jgi:hypothetical protein
MEAPETEGAKDEAEAVNSTMLRLYPVKTSHSLALKSGRYLLFRDIFIVEDISEMMFDELQTALTGELEDSGHRYILSTWRPNAARDYTCGQERLCFPMYLPHSWEL